MENSQQRDMSMVQVHSPGTLVSQAGSYRHRDDGRLADGNIPPFISHRLQQERRFTPANQETHTALVSANSQLAPADPPTRKRIAVACGRCRQRKIRCSGDVGHNIPCTNCKNAGVAHCLFLRVSSRETPMTNGMEGSNIAGLIGMSGINHNGREFGYNTSSARALAHRSSVPSSSHYAGSAIHSESYRSGDVYSFGRPYLPSSEYGGYNMHLTSFSNGPYSPVVHEEPTYMVPYPWNTGRPRPPPVEITDPVDTATPPLLPPLPHPATPLPSQAGGDYHTTPILPPAQHPHHHQQSLSAGRSTPQLTHSPTVSLASYDSPMASPTVAHSDRLPGDFHCPTSVPTAATAASTDTLATRPPASVTSAAYPSTGSSHHHNQSQSQSQGQSQSQSRSQSYSSHHTCHHRGCHTSSYTSSLTNPEDYGISTTNESIFSEQERGVGTQGPAFSLSSYTYSSAASAPATPASTSASASLGRPLLHIPAYHHRMDSRETPSTPAPSAASTTANTPNNNLVHSQTYMPTDGPSLTSRLNSATARRASSLAPPSYLSDSPMTDYNARQETNNRG